MYVVECRRQDLGLRIYRRRFGIWGSVLRVSRL